jgi:hypothetical protein
VRGGPIFYDLDYFFFGPNIGKNTIPHLCLLLKLKS